MISTRVKPFCDLVFIMIFLYLIIIDLIDAEAISRAWYKEAARRRFAKKIL
jgi:hypothetical protein